MSIEDKGILDYATIGEVSFAGVPASEVGLVFSAVDGPYAVEAERDIIRLLAQHGGRAVGRNLIPPRRVAFDPNDEWYEEDNRARLIARRDQIFHTIVRPALLGEIEIHFHETGRSIWGGLTSAVFTDGLANAIRELERFFQFGMQFVCSDPLLYSQTFGASDDERLTFATGRRYTFELGHLDSFMELQLTGPITGTISIEDEVSGHVFAYNGAVKAVPTGSALVMNSRIWDVYHLNLTTEAKDRTGVLDAVTSSWPLPNLTRGKETPEAALLVNTGTGGLGKVIYRRTFLTL